MTDFAKVLNPEQCRAATASDGPLLVLAAAGTGKTRTLVHRVAYLVEKGVPPERILLLTFTNRAAREMLERAGQTVPGVNGIWSGTFHSVCARFLRRYGAALGYPPSFTILDEDDQKKLMGDCIKKIAKAPKDFPKKELLLKMLSDAANREKDLEALVASYQTRVALDPAEVLEVLRAYEARKKELAAMDFDDLLVNGLRLLREQPEICARLQEHFLHVLVDEYQDTNTIQAQFTDLLAARHRNLMVVGDDFQCIYTWRGAEFENIRRFPERWPDCRIVKLERNYRSDPAILDVANTVMRDVAEGFEKTLRPFRPANGKLPKIYYMWDGRQQADVVMSLARQLHAQGVPWTDIAVLYRSHYTSIDIQMTLTRNRVPFRITSGMGVFEQLHVKDVLAFLRLCVDPRAELSFLRLMQLFPGLGEAGAKKLWTKLGGSFDGTSAMDRMNLDSMMPARAKPSWDKVAEAFAAAPAHLAAHEDRLLVTDFTRLFYADDLHRRFEEDEAASRVEDLDEITAQIATCEGGLRGFLAEVALMTNLDANARANLPEDHMHLTTVHQAKGMEWPYVILPWLVEDIFPSKRSVEDGNVSEERRLFYVAVTRAKDRLFLCVPRTRRTAEGTSFPCEPSIFVNEIPKTLVEEQALRMDPAALGLAGGGGRPYRREGAYGAGAYGDGSADYGGGAGSTWGTGGNRLGGGFGSKKTTTYKTTWRR